MSQDQKSESKVESKDPQSEIITNIHRVVHENHVLIRDLKATVATMFGLMLEDDKLDPIEEEPSLPPKKKREKKKKESKVKKIEEKES